MFKVVPVKEGRAKGPAVLDRSEPIRKLGTILERFELALGKGIVIGYVGAAVGFGYPKIAKQKRQAFGLHGGAPIGMQRQLVFADALLKTGFFN